MLVIQQHARPPEALWLKCGCVLLSYPYLDVPNDPVADDETYLRLMAFHPDRVIHIRGRGLGFPHNSAPALFDHVEKKHNLFGDPAGSRGSVKTWAVPTPSTRENQTFRYALSEDLSGHVSITRYSAR